MDRTNILTFLQEHKSEFNTKFGIARIALFGSFARNEATDQSDINLLVGYVNNPGDVYMNKRNFKKFLQDYFHRNIDVANEKYLKPFAKDAILRDAIYV
jgi:predicted nucleotidyltransferase